MLELDECLIRGDELFSCVLALLFNSGPYYWQAPSLAPLKATLAITGLDGACLCICIDV